MKFKINFIRLSIIFLVANVFFVKYSYCQMKDSELMDKIKKYGIKSKMVYCMKFALDTSHCGKRYSLYDERGLLIYEKSTINDSVFFLSRNIYNKTGNVLSNLIYSSDSSKIIQTDNYKYNNQGKVIEVTKNNYEPPKNEDKTISEEDETKVKMPGYRDSTISSKTLFYYDATGKVSKEEYFDEDSLIRKSISYIYNISDTGSSRERTIIIYNNEQVEYSKNIETVFYDGNYRVIRNVLINYPYNEHPKQNLEKFYYDRNGNLFLKENFTNWGSILEKTNYSYDSNGKLIYIQKFDLHEKIKVKIDYIYDDEGNNIERTYHNRDNKDWYQRFVMNKYGDTIEYTEYSGSDLNRKKLISNYKFTYDFYH